MINKILRIFLVSFTVYFLFSSTAFCKQDKQVSILTHEGSFPLFVPDVDLHRIYPSFEFNRTNILAVFKNGDVLIPDGDKVKIFNFMMINEKSLDNSDLTNRENNPYSGRKVNYQVTVGPLGYVCVSEAQLNIIGINNRYMNVYDHEYRHLDTENIRNNQYLTGLIEELELDPDNFGIRKMIIINENKRVYLIDALKQVDYQQYGIFELLLYEDKNTIELLYQGIKFGNISTARLTNYVEGIIDLQFEVLDNGFIVYSHPHYDNKINEVGAEYILHIFDTRRKRAEQIIHKYDPVENPSPADKHIGGLILREEHKDLKIDDIVSVDRLIKQDKLPPFSRIIADGDFLFVILNNKNKTGEHLTDIFDMSSGKYLRSVYFPPRFAEQYFPEGDSTIQNGFAYLLEYSPSKSPELILYRINPPVYRK
ncbi:hypothetical protein ACFL7D_06825 [candidate division KSB1 bacterium]